jgi:hypothetical protein
MTLAALAECYNRPARYASSVAYVPMAHTVFSACEKAAT